MSDPTLPPEPNSQPTSPGWPPTPDDQWEPVNFPHAQRVDDIPPATPASTGPEQAAPRAETEGSAHHSEAELLQLIHDLNQCNEALLARVADLEEALERCQTALQAEVERANRDEGTPQGSPYAIAQNQQIAQLVSELDSSQEALKRQQIRNDTLQAEIDTQAGRIAQLERECTLLRQQYTEKASALEQSNTSNRDLQARLQRQQRYTLQFKAALEKCLDMSSVRTDSPPTVPGLLPDPLAMPKSQRIQPWSSETTAAPPLDPALDSLLRGDKPSRPVTNAPQTTPDPAPNAAAPSGDSGYGCQEDGLWQDLERVIETSIESPAPPAPPTAEAPTFSEPSPWGPPVAPAAPAPQTPTPAPEATAQQRSAAEASPETAPTPAPPFSNPKPIPTEATSAPADLPIMTPTADSSPAPVVYPLRPKKKPKNLAAIDLPSFPRLSKS